MIGGASNVGGKILRQHFSDKELIELSEKINPAVPSGLDYYPLTEPGERFPVNDPNLQPRLTPRPDDKVIFLQGILEGIAKVENRCLDLMSEISGTKPARLFTSGGGAMNRVFSEIRQRVHGIPTEQSLFSEAAYGSAILALKGDTKPKIEYEQVY